MQGWMLFSQLPRCVVAMAAYGGAHFWGREIGEFAAKIIRNLRPASG